MKRPLTEQEVKMCKTGLKNREKKIKFLKTEIQYFKEFNQFNDKWKKYREEKEKSTKDKKELILKETLQMLIDSLTEEKRLMSVEQDQLDNGVEVKQIKKMVGVN